MSRGPDSQRIRKLKKAIRTRCIYFLYSFLARLGIPIVALYLVIRGFRIAAISRAFLSDSAFSHAPYGGRPPGAIWLHAVSGREVMSAAPLIRRLTRPVYLSVTTIAGREIAEKTLGSEVAGIFFVPFDYIFLRPPGASRFAARARPGSRNGKSWPNCYREARRSGARPDDRNGRISIAVRNAIAAWRWFFAPVLAQPHVIYVQSESDRERYAATGAPPDLVRVGGNLKYDFTPREDIAPEIQGFLKRIRTIRDLHRGEHDAAA